MKSNRRAEEKKNRGTKDKESGPKETKQLDKTRDGDRREFSCGYGFEVGRKRGRGVCGAQDPQRPEEDGIRLTSNVWYLLCSPKCSELGTSRLALRKLCVVACDILKTDFDLRWVGEHLGVGVSAGRPAAVVAHSVWYRRDQHT